jgi:hypothetical protein
MLTKELSKLCTSLGIATPESEEELSMEAVSYLKKCNRALESFFKSVRDVPTLSHRGLRGTCEISLADKCLFGRVINVEDLIVYEGNDIDSLIEAFESTVNLYLDKDRHL